MHFDADHGAYFDFGNHTEKVYVPSLFLLNVKGRLIGVQLQLP